MRDRYLSLRSRFEPQDVKLAIVAESPPISGKYFYNPEGHVSEPLFAALMRSLRFVPDTKQEGLNEFRNRGWVLVDATYEPVNVVGKDRDAVILRDYEMLRGDLDRMLPDRSTPVVLVKENVCRLLDDRLRQDGFNVLNRGRVVYFPSTGRQRQFQQQFADVCAIADR